MSKSTNGLGPLLDTLTRHARRLGLTDTEWAARAGVRKETLSRLRSRSTCDLHTLRALASAVGRSLGILPAAGNGVTSDDHFPVTVDRDLEDRLVELCASGSYEADDWSALGDPFFMAGLAVLLASSRSYDRRRLLALAEQLHPGASEPAVFARWLERSPVRPWRFLPLVDARARESRLAHAS
ncbi:MAG: helix-turn-helix domain-containing protein [Gammaproteobacteria bacterium]